MVKLSLILSLLAIFPLTLSAPHCYHKEDHVVSTFELNSQFNTDSSSLELRLIQTSENEPPEWMNENQIMSLMRNKIKFMDVTDYMELGTSYKPNTRREYPVQPSFLKKYYRSSYGVKSSEWLYRHILDLVKNAADNNLDVDVSVRKFPHTWDQNSIIARFEGYDSKKQNEVVIVGAHQDSINLWSPRFGRAPGGNTPLIFFRSARTCYSKNCYPLNGNSGNLPADDDGSGTVSILEAFRVLVEGKFRPQRPVEFHWYSAEEAGLLGSQAIALEYEKEGKDVIGMLQNDMTGFVGRNKEAFGIVNDYVDQGLTTFITKLIDSYASLPYRLTRCGYACSDHASWRKAGYPSAFAIEGDFSDTNPHIHSPNDLPEHLSFEHMLEFSKLSVSFAVELSHEQ